MTDYSELVERMRAYPANRLCIQVADALEAQAKRIAHLESHGELNEKLIQSLRDQVTEGDARIAELEVALGEAEKTLFAASRILSEEPCMRIALKGKQWGRATLNTIRAALKGEK
jgi:uncharacterized coiled-coil protein SlyX